MALLLCALPTFCPRAAVPTPARAASHASASQPRASLLGATRAELLRWSTAAALSAFGLPAVAREMTPNEQREALQAIIDKRGGLDPGAPQSSPLGRVFHADTHLMAQNDVASSTRRLCSPRTSTLNMVCGRHHRRSFFFACSAALALLLLGLPIDD